MSNVSGLFQTHRMTICASMKVIIQTVIHVFEWSMNLFTE